MRIALLTAALVAASVSPALAQETDPTLSQLLRDDGRFTVLLEAVEAAGLSGALAGSGPLTVFAPTDSAFAALPSGTLEALTPDDLRAIILGHVLEGAVPSSAAAEVGAAETVSGAPLTFALDPLTVNDAPILEADLEASNGIIHVIGAVLLPPEAPEDL